MKNHELETSPAGGAIGKFIIGNPSQMLSQAEATELLTCEEVINKNQEAFLEAGVALMTIREKKLYRYKFATFEAYCRDRWQFTAHRARQLIHSAEVIENLCAEPEALPNEDPAATTDRRQETKPAILPSTESQARPLARLPKEKQRQAWDDAIESAPAGKVTARHVEASVAKFQPKIIEVSKQVLDLLDRSTQPQTFVGSEKEAILYILPPSNWEDTLWVAASSVTGDGRLQEVEAYALVPLKKYSGPAKVRDSFQGLTVMWKSKAYRLGIQTIFKLAGAKATKPAPIYSSPSSLRQKLNSSHMLWTGILRDPEVRGSKELANRAKAVLHHMKYFSDHLQRLNLRKKSS